MLKKILWTLLVIISAIIVFFVVWPILYSQWSGLGLGAYPTGNEDKTLAEQLGYSRDDIILIVHADDLAIHKDQTDGALDAMKKVYDDWLRNLKPGVHHLIIHPSFMSKEYEQVVWRPYILTGDHAYWSSSETKVLAKELGIIFIGYRELQRLQAKNWGLDTDGVNYRPN
jgi:hypothetical protein